LIFGNPPAPMSIPGRIFRRIRRFLSGSSLLLCVLFLACWLRGLWRVDWFQFHGTDLQRRTWWGFDVVVARNRLYLSWQKFYFPDPVRTANYAKRLQRTGTFRHFDQLSAPFQDPRTDPWHRLGFGALNQTRIHDRAGDEKGNYFYEYTFRNLSLPYWFLLLVFSCGALPIIFRIRSYHRRRYRMRNNLCISCGYDLRNPSDRCPECGEVTSTATAQLATGRK